MRLAQDKITKTEHHEGRYSIDTKVAASLPLLDHSNYVDPIAPDFLLRRGIFACAHLSLCNCIPVIFTEYQHH